MAARSVGVNQFHASVWVASREGCCGAYTSITNVARGGRAEQPDIS